MKKQIYSLGQLRDAAIRRKSVIVPKSYTFDKPTPAAFMMNQIGGCLLNLFREGMFEYEKPKKRKFGEK